MPLVVVGNARRREAFREVPDLGHGRVGPRHPDRVRRRDLRASTSAADAVARIVTSLLRPGARWINQRGEEKPLTPADILVVAPYNAQVSLLGERLDPLGVRVGTVDRFQGQEAPIVVYSMAISTPEEAPRGMDFLYSLNRLNVATSRARCACILVASPRLFEPECKSPRQMQLANAVCRYVELARAVEVP